MNFLWTTLHVKDMNASLTFYKNIVGLKENRRSEYPNGPTIVFLGNSETQIELIYKPLDKLEGMSKDFSIGFKIDSVDDMIKELELKDIPVYEGPKEPNPSIKFFYVLDPDGVKVQFVEFK
jgi:lactoylglutathione lyase